MSDQELRIGGLQRPVLAAKSNWDVAEVSLDFTPKSTNPGSREALLNSVAKQIQGGLVVEYISKTIEKPNPGFENDPDFLKALKRRESLAGRLIAVHRVRASALPLSDIIGKSAFEKLQNMWDTSGSRHRWSVAFPIIETFAIVDPPDAQELFGKEAYIRIFGHPAGLRPLNEGERAVLADLVVEPRPAPNMWIAIEQEAAKADGGGIDPKIVDDIDDDLTYNLMEGLTENQKQLVRKRASWLANSFWLSRWKRNLVTCDNCEFNPVARTEGSDINPRSLMDVHHTKPLSEGNRLTKRSDFQLLCPNCHRYEHAVLRMANSR